MKLIPFGCIWISELLDRLLDCWELGFVTEAAFNVKSVGVLSNLHRLHGRNLTPELRGAADKAWSEGKVWGHPFGANLLP